MSEQDEREKAEARVRIAGSQVECPECEGDETPSTVYDEGHWVCPKCKATPGKVYRFGEELRQPCECIDAGPCSACYRLRQESNWAAGP